MIFIIRYLRFAALVLKILYELRRVSFEVSPILSQYFIFLIFFKAIVWAIASAISIILLFLLQGLYFFNIPLLISSAFI